MIGPTTSGRSLPRANGLQMAAYEVRVVAAFMI
jgi:hypothetical protein